MNALLVFLCLFLGIIFAILILALIIYLKIKSSIPKEYRNEFNFKEAVKVSKEIAKEERSRPKAASGITNLLIPQIMKDFPDFNVEEFYTLVESNLRAVFNIIETKDLSLITSSLEPLKGNLKEIVNDLKRSDINIRYDDIVFHKHALRNYIKEQGIATLTISSSLEYYYYYDKENKYKENSNIKKQTRYLCTYAYIYDKEKAKTKLSVIGLNCPNCGAPLEGFSQTTCKYCGTHTIELDLKSWRFISYKED